MDISAGATLGATVAAFLGLGYTVYAKMREKENDQVQQDRAQLAKDERVMQELKGSIKSLESRVTGMEIGVRDLRDQVGELAERTAAHDERAKATAEGISQRLDDFRDLLIQRTTRR